MKPGRQNHQGLCQRRPSLSYRRKPHTLPGEYDPSGQAPAVESVEHRQFLVMQSAYFPHLGLATREELARLMHWRTEHPASTLAHWIASRVIVSFEWGSLRLIPLFQFDFADMSPHAGVVEIIRELSDVLDDWDLSLWFAQPNRWLDDVAPVDGVARDQAAVFQAARADRFIVRG